MTDKIRAYLRGEKGFTLVEMMVVLIIIAVLIAGGIRFYIGYIGRSKVTKSTGDITTVQAALDSYYAQHFAYPSASDPASLEAAGLSTSMVATAADTSTDIPYRYDVVVANGYKVYTRASLDSSNHYVEGTGVSGISNSPVTTLSF